MAEKKPEKMNVQIDPGPEVFFSDTVTVSHTQSKFVIDFVQMVPRFDYIAGRQEQTLVVKHNAVIMDPVVAKNFLNVLRENIRKYEKQFGKIEVPKKKPQKAKKERVETKYIG